MTSNIDEVNMSKIYNLILTILPEGKTKNKVRILFYNLINPFFKIKMLDNETFLVKSKTGASFKISNISAMDLGNDLIASRGYVLKYPLKKNDVVIDAGAYKGSFTLFCAKSVGDGGKVIAFEPDSENFKILKKNVKLNNLTNVILIKKGLWKKNEQLFFNEGDGENSSLFFDKMSKKKITKVACVSLDSELARLKIHKVEFVKMDIEGAELEAIAGMKKILAKNKLSLAIASYHIVNSQKTCFKLEKDLTKLNYNAVTLFKKHLTTYAENK